jgi:hypothetical protein
MSTLDYRRFPLRSAVGGVVWRVYTCLLAYAIGIALAEFPIASGGYLGLPVDGACRRRSLEAATRPPTPRPAGSTDVTAPEDTDHVQTPDRLVAPSWTP